MAKDKDRRERIQHAIQAAGFETLVCAHPKNVLLLTGYWPIIGNALAIVNASETITLIVPEDELEYASNANADEIIGFNVGESPLEDIRKPLLAALDARGASRIGIERGPISQEASYVGMMLYGCSLSDFLAEISPQCSLESADNLLERERAVLTSNEIERLRIAVKIAEEAFAQGLSKMVAGISEVEAAQNFESPLSTLAVRYPGVIRARGRVSCMSGERSGNAYGAFAMSSSKIIQKGELILLHMNSHADGFWTDITRTYYIGAMPERIRTMYEAVLEASQAGIASVKPNTSAGEVDRTVREILTKHGFGNAVKHSTGHGVGFSAIDHDAIPRLKKNSSDILEPGMVMNIEPGIYFEGFGGIRQCNMVLVTEHGSRVLTPFHNTIQELHARAS